MFCWFSKTENIEVVEYKEIDNGEENFFWFLLDFLDFCFCFFW